MPTIGVAGIPAGASITILDDARDVHPDADVTVKL